MFEIFQNYVLNFWVWWYLINGRDVAVRLWGAWSFTLAYFNVVPMLQNLFVPLFQDNTRTGALVSIPIRMIWVVVGGFMQLLISIPLLLLFILYLGLPLLPLFMIATVFFNR